MFQGVGNVCLIMWTTQNCWVRMQCCEQISRTFILLNWNFILTERQLPISSSLPTTISLLNSVNLTILDTSYKRDHAAFVLYQRLISLSIMSSRSGHVVTYCRISSIFRPSSNPLSTYTMCPYPFIQWWTLWLVLHRGSCA